jgi:ATP-dependent helicase/nuclease subunit A
MGTTENKINNQKFLESFLQIIEFLKNVLSVFTFQDIIVEMYRALVIASNNLNHLMNIWDAYDLILVDETQDFSPMQLEILCKMMEEMIYNSKTKDTAVFNTEISNILMEKPNIGGNVKNFFLFGDIKQSIFNFQGANLDFFKNRINNLCLLAQKQHYICKIQRINSTYRLAPEINNFINKLHSITGLDGFQQHSTHSLKNGKVYYSPPEILKNEEQIVDNILNLIGSLVSQGRKLGDIMVIFRTRDRLVHKLATALKDSTFECAGLDTVSVRQDSILFNLLTDLMDLLQNQDKLFPWILFIGKYLLNYISQEGLNNILQLIGCNEPLNIPIILQKESAEIQELMDFIQAHRDIIYKTSAYFFLTQGLMTLKIFANCLAKERKDLLFNILKEADNFSGNPLEFLNFIPSTFKSQPIGIQMNTVYGAKGLQSKIIIICDGHRGPVLGDWQETFYYYNREFTSQEEKKHFLNNKRNKIFEEYLRVLYVATTRASQELYIFGNYPVEIQSLIWYIQSHFQWSEINLGKLNLRQIIC